MARDDIDRELDAHLAHAVDDLIRAGYTREDARRRAIASLGGIAQTRERVHDVRAWRWIDDARDDLRYAWRALRRSPGFGATAIGIIALGIAATTAAFTVLDHLLLRPLPFPEPSRLVRLYQTAHARGMTQIEASPPNFEDWRAGSKSFSGMASFLYGGSTNVLGSGEPRQVDSATFDANVLNVLGVQPLVGRGFTAADEKNFSDIAILRYDFAVATFGSPSAALNRTLNLDNRARTVIGVMPPGFTFPSRDPVLWLPMVPFNLLGQSRTNLLLNVVARLRPGTSLTQAQAEMDVIADRLRREYPNDNAGAGIAVTDLRDVVSSQARMLVWTVFAAALCLLLIVCTNLTNLLLARAVVRRQEMAVRVAIGAGVARLVRQMLTESAVLVFAGAAVGAALATVAVPVIARIVPDVLPVTGAPAVNLRVLAFAALAAVVTCLAVGVVPALRSSRTADAQALRVRSGTQGGGRLRSALVLAEIAATVTLLVGGGLLIKAMWRVQAVDLGFDARGVLTLRTNLPFIKYPTWASRRAFYQRVLTDTSALPGVISAGYTAGLPLVLGAGIMAATVPGVDDPATAPRASIRSVTPGYFATMQIPLKRGRFVDERDTSTSMPAAVISEGLARRLWPDQDPIGRTFTIFNHTRTVVGVTGDILVRGLERTSEPQIYVAPEQLAPFSVFYGPRDLVVRASGNALALAPAIRKIVHDADPEQPISDFRLFDAVVAGQTAARRDQLIVLGLFAATAVLLAAIGIHGLLAYLVRARTHEVGVRVALGARPVVIMKMFLAQGLTLGLAGIAVGVPIAYAAGRAISTLLFGLTPADPAVYVSAVSLAAVMTLVSSVVPAARAAAVDPLVALRSE